MYNKKPLVDVFGLSADDHASLSIPDLMKRMEQRYLEVMRQRLEAFSAQHNSKVTLPDTFYHASLHVGITELDPTRGQGLGVWFVDNIEKAKAFAASRCKQAHSPAIYEVSLSFQRVAVFPDELSLFTCYLPEANDNEDFLIGSQLSPALIRQSLLDANYDGIALISEGTYSALDNNTINIINCIDLKV